MHRGFPLPFVLSGTLGLCLNLAPTHVDAKGSVTPYPGTPLVPCDGEEKDRHGEQNGVSKRDRDELRSESRAPNISVE